jgi:tetrahydromethanopterin S-methyltransferase subunit A
MQNQLNKIIPSLKTLKTNGVTSDGSSIGSVKSVISLLKEINDEYITLSELIVDTGFTGVEDNFRLREKLNDIIYQIRKTVNFVIKVKNKNKKE